MVCGSRPVLRGFVGCGPMIRGLVMHLLVVVPVLVPVSGVSDTAAVSSATTRRCFFGFTVFRPEDCSSLSVIRSASGSAIGNSCVTMILCTTGSVVTAGALQSSATAPLLWLQQSRRRQRPCERLLRSLRLLLSLRPLPLQCPRLLHLQCSRLRSPRPLPPTASSTEYTPRACLSKCRASASSGSASMAPRTRHHPLQSDSS